MAAQQTVKHLDFGGKFGMEVYGAAALTVEQTGGYRPERLTPPLSDDWKKYIAAPVMGDVIEATPPPLEDSKH